MVMKTCPQCGYTRNTNPLADLCTPCRIAKNRDQFDEDQKERLEANNLIFHKRISGTGIHSKVEVTNKECGHTFIAKTNNLLDGATICGVCGPTKRMAHALKHYIVKYGRTYDLKLWKDYKLKAEIISNQIYDANKQMMNPNNYPRMKPNTHPDAVNLDHIIPMIYGFKNDLPVELISDIRNLRIINASQNLRKRQKLTDEAKTLLNSLKEEWKTVL